MPYHFYRTTNRPLGNKIGIYRDKPHRERRYLEAEGFVPHMEVFLVADDSFGDELMGKWERQFQRLCGYPVDRVRYELTRQNMLAGSSKGAKSQLSSGTHVTQTDANPFKNSAVQSDLGKRAASRSSNPFRDPTFNRTMRERAYCSPNFTGRDPDHIRKMSMAGVRSPNNVNKQRARCSKCGMVSTPGNIARWHNSNCRSKEQCSSSR